MPKFELTNKQCKSAQQFEELLFAHVEKLMHEHELFRDCTLTLDSMAAKIGVTRANLSRTVNNHTGNNFVQYVNGYRVREAIRIMCQTPRNSKNIETICEEIGFNSHNPFYTAFKSVTGQTPAAFRRVNSKQH